MDAIDMMIDSIKSNLRRGRTPMRTLETLARRGAVALTALTLVVASGCDDLLSVENPAQIMEESLDNPQLIPILYNSVIGDFQAMYDDPVIWRGSMFTDEQITGVNWEATARLSQRLIRFDEGDASGMFGSLSRALVMADSVSGRFRGGLLPNPSSDARLATTLTYAGYSYVLMGEIMCEASIKLSDRTFSPEELFGMALARFDEAITIAQAAGATNVLNFARTGAARAALNRGESAKVMSYASSVPRDFKWWAEYGNNSASERNTMWTGVTGANHRIGVHPKFLAGEFGQQGIVAQQTDPRVQHTANWTFGHNALTRLYKPYQGLRYGGYNGQTLASGGQPLLYGPDTNILIADGLEALHHYYEAAGPAGTGPAGTTLEFVNSRRAYGNQPPVNLSGAALMAELRDQRGRDLYLGGFRLGDLRRWKAQGVGDFFPSGTHPTPEWGQYGDAECFPLPSTEYEGNPNLTRP
jgi:hypothetical protein